MLQNINDLYNEYLTGKLSRPEFEGALYNYLIYNQEKTCLGTWKLDKYEDFISWFYPRLRTVIDSYKDVGASFESLFNRYLLISSREYHVRTITNSVIEYSAWSARVPDMYVHEEPPAYMDSDSTDKLTQLITGNKSRKNKRRLLALILKCYYYISESYAKKIAPLIGINSDELIKMINDLQKIRERKDDQIYLLKERIYCQFYRCIIYEKRLSLVQENSSDYYLLKRRQKIARQRLEKMRKRMASIRTEATNKQVADIIGIAKGTVDSSLHKLKVRWEDLSKKADMN